MPTLFAVSDLHVGYQDNAARLDELQPEDEGDWLIVCGDLAELATDIVHALAQLRERFAQVIWVPGNHELWSHPSDPLKLRGVERYDYLVDACRRLGIDTPEDDFPVWPHAASPVVITPLFLLYDYSFLAPGTSTKAESLAKAHEAGVVCTDEPLLFPDPYPTIDDWCRARITLTQRRLDALDPTLPTVLVNHWPMTRKPTEILRYPEFAQWCGTTLTADWHVRYRAEAVVYGHLHIPRLTVEDGVRMEEVSLGYPREWRRRRPDRLLMRPILPPPARYDPAFAEGTPAAAVLRAPEGY